MSKIQWTDETINFVTGCSKVSPGCKNCYAETLTKRLVAMSPGKYGAGFDEVVCHADVFNKTLPTRVSKSYFVNSMSDTFHPDVPDDFIDKIFNFIEEHTRHFFFVLSKRISRARDFLSRRYEDGIPDDNWMLLTSVENQDLADKRIPHLVGAPAPYRGISVEPIRGEVTLSEYLRDLDWIIVGGESGHKSRGTKLEWIRSLSLEVSGSGTPLFIKQLGSRVEFKNFFDPDLKLKPFMVNGRVWLRDDKGGDISEFPSDLRIREPFIRRDP